MLQHTLTYETENMTLIWILNTEAEKNCEPVITGKMHLFRNEPYKNLVTSLKSQLQEHFEKLQKGM